MRKLTVVAFAIAALGAGGAATASLGQTSDGTVDCANRPSTTDLRIVNGQPGRKLKLAAPWGLVEGCDKASDTLAVSVDWGDGKQSAGKVVHTVGDHTQVTLTASHVYAKASAQAYPIVITITNTRTGVVNQDRHYVAQISEPLDVTAQVPKSGKSTITVGGRGRELISVTLRRVSHLRVGSASPVGTLTTSGAKRRTYSLHALGSANGRITLLHRGNLGVVLHRHGAKLLEIGALPRGTTQISLHLASGVLKRTHSCSSAASVRVDAARRHAAPVSVTAPVTC